MAVKANVNARTANGETAALIGTLNGAVHNVAWLVVILLYRKLIVLQIKNGADVNIADSLGNSPLHLAASSGNITLTLLLLKHGAKVNEYNTHNETPLHYAIGNSHWGVTYYLLSAGANVEAPTANGKSE